MAIDCVAIGDSIAVGVATPLACEVRAAVGLTSSRIVQLANGKYHQYCVISAGSNDPTSSKLAQNLTMIRNQSVCKFYVWVLPVNKQASETVAKTAYHFHDMTVTIVPGQDNVHPASYNDLAGAVLEVTGN